MNCWIWIIQSQIIIGTYKNKLSTLPVQEIFAEQTSTYDLRNRRCWEIPKVRTVTYGTETVQYRGPKIWELVPNSIKKISIINIIQSESKKNGSQMAAHLDCVKHLFIILVLFINLFANACVCVFSIYSLYFILGCFNNFISWSREVGGGGW